MNNTNEEIDIKQIIINSFTFIKRYKIVWLISIIAGVVAGIYKYNNSKIYYQAEMIVTSGLLYEQPEGTYNTDLQSIISILRQLESKVKEKNYDFAKNSLKINDISFLKNISLSIISEKSLAKTEPKNIKIQVEVYDKEKINELEKGIIDYCNNNEYILNRFKEQKEIISLFAEILSEKIILADSLEKIMTTTKLNTNDVVFMDFSDWTDVVDLEIAMQKYDNYLNITSPLIIVQKISKYPDVMDDRLKKSVIFFVLTIILGIFFAFMIEILKILKNV